jgi:hypothetical protein
MQNILKSVPRSIILGKGQARHREVIQAITRYLENGTKANLLFADSKHTKVQAPMDLRSFITTHSL